MFSRLFKKKKEKIEHKSDQETPKPRRTNQSKSLDKKISNLSTKQDVEKIINEVVASRDAVLEEVNKVPDSVSNMLVEQITSPLKEFISTELTSGGVKQLSINQAVKPEDVKQLSSNQAVKQKGLEEVISQMKDRLESLSQRHLRILNILIQNRDGWLDYEELGKYCNPQLTGSCIRGYVADLINSYRIPIEKRNFGRRSKIKLSEKVVKQLAISKLID